MNEVRVQGRLTKDPELTVGNKAPYCRFSIAIPRKGAKRPNGDPDYTAVDFCNVTAFAKTAERLCEYGKKGDTVFVDGCLSWYKKTDQPYPVMTVNANDLTVDKSRNNVDYTGSNNKGVADKGVANKGDDYFADSDDYVAPPFDL